jgi:LDH2 family malate/lactate/ureidoglycolate dehydrogenase
MSEKTVRVPVDMIHDFMIDVFVALGVPSDDAKTCAQVLITSDLRGIESHGAGRLKMYYDRFKQGILSPITQFEIVKETETTAVIDGHNGMGHVIGVRAMQMAIDKARQYGMGSAAVRESTHFGIDGYYALMAVDQGMIGMAFTNARPSMAPTFGVDPLLGTNPIAFGAPSDEEFPFLYDAATSITQRGKIEVLDRAMKPTPAGWVIDRQGKTATDTKAILEGLKKKQNAFVPLGGIGETLGGHKGYGLATMVEILSASLQSGMFLRALSGFNDDGSPRPHHLGHFFMAIDIEHFVPLDEFKKTTGHILRKLRNSTVAPGEEKIYTAGEKEWLKEKEIREYGIPVNPNLQKDLLIMKDDLGLNTYNFPF